MNTDRAVILAIGLSLGLGACGGAAAPSARSSSPSPSAVQHRSLSVDGQKRTYRLFRPASIDPTRPVALVFVLHGSTLSGDEIASTSHFDDQAKTSGFIAAYPDGLGGAWQAGGDFGTSEADVIFIGRLLDRLMTDFAIDRTRVFVAGVSLGGMMAYRLACELSDRIAAIASISGSMFVDECHPGRPVSILEMHGTDDSFVPYAGGRSGLRYFPATASIIQRWVTLDGCPGDPSVSSSGITKTSTWKGCRNRTAVKLDTVQDGRHTWFGSTFDAVDGEPDANAEIWDFFSTLGRPA